MRRWAMVLIGFFMIFSLLACQGDEKITIQFDTNGAAEIDDLVIDKDTKEINLPEPTKTGYLFDGWFLDEALSDPFTLEKLITNRNPILYAKWRVDETVTYTITFNSNGGSAVSNITNSAGTVILKPDDPIRAGYTFINWYTDENLSSVFNFTVMPANNLTLYAKWEKVVVIYQITFETNGGNEVSPKDVGEGSAIGSLAVPTKEGHTFVGWFMDEGLTNPMNLTVMPSNHFTLYAKWSVNNYTITFNSNGGSLVSPMTSAYNESITKPADPTKEGHAFVGWFSDSGLTTAYTFNVMGSSNQTLYAKWSVNNYTITFNSMGGSLVSPMTRMYNESITKPADPTKEGHAFVGWFSDSGLTTAYTFSVMGSSNQTLYAKWSVNNYTITFNSNGGSLVSPMTSSYNESITKPDDPTKEGHTFVGWFSDSGLMTAYTFNVMGSSNQTLYAKWSVNNYTITFNSMGGSLVSPMTSAYSESITKPADPTKEGHTFVGWFSDSGLTTAYTFNVMGSSNQILYAKWSVNNYTIAFNSNGGTIIEEKQVIYDMPIGMLLEPTKENYQFDGWYLDIDLLVMMDLTVMPNQNLTLYAKWIDLTNKEAISYVSSLDEGTSASVKGIIYYIFDNEEAVLIYDETGYMKVFTDRLNRQLNEAVRLTGTVVTEGSIKALGDVTLVESLAIDQTPKTPVSVTMGVLLNPNLNHEQYRFNLIETEGILVEDQGHLYLYDLVSFLPIMISPAGLQPSELMLLVQSNLQKIKISFIYDYDTISYYNVTSFDQMPLTLNDELQLIESYYQLFVFKDEAFVGDFFFFEGMDPLGLSNLSYQVSSENEQYIDVVNHRFIQITEAVNIEFTLLLTSTKDDTITRTFTYQVMVYPIILTAIDEVLTGTLNQTYLFGGVVIATTMEGAMLIKDETASIMVRSSSLYPVGTYLTVQGQTMKERNQVIVSDVLPLTLTRLSEDNGFELMPLTLSVAEFLALDFTDPLIYGTYISLRGYLIDFGGMDYHYHTIMDDDGVISIEPMTHDGFEKLMGYQNIEVHMKGFIGNLHESVGILYQGIRADVLIPNYTDEERLEAIKTILHYQYNDRIFSSFEYHMLMPRHHVLGGEITYEFVGYPSIYDRETNRFNYVLEDEIIDLKISVLLNGLISEFIVSITILKEAVYEITELFSQKYNELILHGYLFYYHPSYSYLTDNQGNYVLVRINLEGLEVGDEVYLYVYPNQTNQTITIVENYIGIETILEVISKNNVLNVQKEPLSLGDILAMDYKDSLNYNRYVELVADVIAVNQTNIELKTYEGYLSVESPDPYTYQKLRLYHGKTVTISVMIHTTDYNKKTFVRFLGNDDDLALKSYSDQEKIDTLEAFILDMYQQPRQSDQALSLQMAQSLFSGVQISYEATEEQTVIDFENQWINAVTEETLIEVQATIVVNELQKDVLFTMKLTPVEELVITSISDALLTTEVVTIEATVIGVIDSNKTNHYILVLKDETGIIEVELDYETYQATNDYGTSGYVSDVLRIKGSFNPELGAHRFNVINLMPVIRNQIITETFEEATILSYQQYSNEDEAIFGKPITLSGLLKSDTSTYPVRYYLEEGPNKVYLALLDLNNPFVRYYENYVVKVNGFIYGYHPLFDENDVSLMVINYNYNGKSIQLDGYSDEEILSLVKKTIEENHWSYNPLRQPNEYVSLSSIPMPFSMDLQELALSYQVVDGEEFIDPYFSPNYNYFTTKYASIDQVIVLEVTITLDQLSTSLLLEYQLNGFEFETLESLFELDQSTQEIALEGVVLNKGFGYLYVYVEGEVYYLETYSYGYVNENSIVTIIGRKQTINGEADYTYDIFYYETGYDTLELTYTDVTIEALYLNDYDLNPLHKSPLSVWGKLGYDRYLDLYTLSLDNNVIYLRNSSYDFSVYDQYINQYVRVYGFMSQKQVLHDYFLFDVTGSYESITREDPSLDVQQKEVYDWLISHYDNHVFYEGDNLSDLYEGLIYGEVGLNLSLNNESDSQYFDVYGLQVYEVALEVMVSLNVRLNVEGFDDLTGMIHLILRPREMISLEEVILSSQETTIRTTGVITYIDQSVSYDVKVVISDLDNHVLVHYNPYQTTEQTVTLLNLGDEVTLVGSIKRNNQVGTTFLDEVSLIKVIGNQTIEPSVIEEETFESLHNLPYIKRIGLYELKIEGILRYQNGMFYLESDTLFESTYYGNIYYKILLSPSDDSLYYQSYEPWIGTKVMVSGFTYLRTNQLAFDFEMLVYQTEQIVEIV
ncbi:MAG: InlB B-repeat-containing protein [Paracholeplasma sp.]|nr:InlB B-repeat-containing protein [Paracholeplasma sp.]MDY3196476.1 InlB B-repeat-containing protein [Paracholeplasma sp.]